MIEMHTHKQRGCSVPLKRSIDCPNFPAVGAEQREKDDERISNIPSLWLPHLTMLLQFELALVGFVLSSLTFVGQVVLMIWTYSDATDNSSHPAVLWTLVVLFAPLFGVMLYLLFGRDQR